MRLLSRAEFLATFADPMKRIEEGDAYDPINLREYVTECIAELIPAVTLDRLNIHDIYINANRTFYQVLIEYGRLNQRLVIVVDCVEHAIHGHYYLDLNAEYGLDDNGWPLDDSEHDN